MKGRPRPDGGAPAMERRLAVFRRTAGRSRARQPALQWEASAPRRQPLRCRKRSRLPAPGWSRPRASRCGTALCRWPERRPTSRAHTLPLRTPPDTAAERSRRATLRAGSVFAKCARAYANANRRPPVARDQIGVPGNDAGPVRSRCIGKCCKACSASPTGRPSAPESMPGFDHPVAAVARVHALAAVRQDEHHVERLALAAAFHAR